MSKSDEPVAKDEPLTIKRQGFFYQVCQSFGGFPKAGAGRAIRNYFGSRFGNASIKSSHILRLFFGYASIVPGWEKMS
jgi:hypothetical protein